MFNRFSEFHSKWMEQSDANGVTSCQKWMDGICYEKEGSDEEHAANEGDRGADDPDKCTDKSKRSGNRTKKMTLHRHESAPFRTFYRYVVEKDPSDSS